MSAADMLTAAIWLLSCTMALAICAMQRSRSAVIFGLALIASPTFYLTLLLIFRDVSDVRAFASAHRTGTLIGGVQFLLLCWSLVLAVRLAFAKPGSRVTLTGKLLPPGPDEIEWALVILARADRHDLLNQVTVKWGQEDVYFNKAMKLAEDRGSLVGARVKMILRLLQPRLYRRATARWALRKVHFAEPDNEEESR